MSALLERDRMPALTAVHSWHADVTMYSYRGIALLSS